MTETRFKGKDHSLSYLNFQTCMLFQHNIVIVLLHVPIVHKQFTPTGLSHRMSCAVGAGGQGEPEEVVKTLKSV